MIELRHQRRKKKVSVPEEWRYCRWVGFGNGEGVNSSIVLKHESELIRLRAEIKQAEDLIRKVDAEIDLLQAIYDRMNR